MLDTVSLTYRQGGKHRVVVQLDDNQHSFLQAVCSEKQIPLVDLMQSIVDEMLRLLQHESRFISHSLGTEMHVTIYDKENGL